MPSRTLIRLEIIDHLSRFGPTTLNGLVQMIGNQYPILIRNQQRSSSRPNFMRWEIWVREIVFELSRWGTIQRISPALYRI